MTLFNSTPRKAPAPASPGLAGQWRGLRWRLVLALVVAALLTSWIPIARSVQLDSGVMAQVGPALGSVNMYSLPDATLQPEAQLHGGTFVSVTGRDVGADWYHVEVPGSISGWLPADQLTVLASGFDAATLPLIPVDEETILTYSLLWNFDTHNNLAVFQRGQANGNQLNGLAKVGDSITASQMFLYPFSAGVYDLQAYPHLQHVLDFFGTDDNSPFGRQSVAVQNGWSTADVLSERRALQRGCPAGTTPLTCEYNTSQPAYALIMLGTNDAVVLTVDEYERNLGEIVEITLGYDIVPVLFTSPPLQSPEYDVRPYNHAVIRVSQQYDVAVINYWLAVQPLPNKGISSDRIHPSGPPSNAGTTLFTPEYLQYGYTVRNLVTLQGLDLLLRNTVYPAFG